jgi:hypothetical protein
LHLRAGDVHVLAVTRDNVNAMLAFSFMVKVREGGRKEGGGLWGRRKRRERDRERDPERKKLKKNSQNSKKT